MTSPCLAVTHDRPSSSRIYYLSAAAAAAASATMLGASTPLADRCGTVSAADVSNTLRWRCPARRRCQSAIRVACGHVYLGVDWLRRPVMWPCTDLSWWQRPSRSNLPPNKRSWYIASLTDRLWFMQLWLFAVNGLIWSNLAAEYTAFLFSSHGKWYQPCSLIVVPVLYCRLVLLSLAAAAFLANKDVYYACSRPHWPAKAFGLRCPVVRSLFCYQIVNMMFWKRINRYDANWNKWFTGQGQETINFGAQGSKVKVTRSRG